MAIPILSIILICPLTRYADVIQDADYGPVCPQPVGF